jgi:hypothetical protein
VSLARTREELTMAADVIQTGNVFQHSDPWSQTAPTYGRYWIDIPGSTERKRRTVSLGLCSTRSVARRKLREHIEVEGINCKKSFATNTAPATTFRAQAKLWIESLPTRRRKPVKPCTVVPFPTGSTHSTNGYSRHVETSFSETYPTPHCVN